MIEAIPYLIVGLIGFGMGVSFFAADPRSPTSRALSLMWCLLGLAAAMNIPAAASRGTAAHVWLWERLYSIVDPAIMVCGLEWILRIGRTQAARDEHARAGELLLRGAQALACLYGAAGLAFPETRAEFWATPRHFRFVSRPEFYLFAIPYLGLGVGVASGFVTVGTIGSGRLEYAAVGPAVNLASRLASRAEAGQVLAEPRVVGLAGDGNFRFEKLESAELKGFARPVVVYSVSGASRGRALTRGVA